MRKNRIHTLWITFIIYVIGVFIFSVSYVAHHNVRYLYDHEYRIEQAELNPPSREGGPTPDPLKADGYICAVGRNGETDYCTRDEFVRQNTFFIPLSVALTIVAFYFHPVGLLLHTLSFVLIYFAVSTYLERKRLRLCAMPGKKDA